MMRFQIPFMSFLFLVVIWTDSVTGDMNLAKDLQASTSRNCTQDQYYNKGLELCSPCKELCHTVPCPLCPNFVLSTQSTLETKPEHSTMDEGMRAFWIVLLIIIICVCICIVIIIIWQRHRLIDMCKKKGPRFVEAEMELKLPLQCQNTLTVV